MRRPVVFLGGMGLALVLALTLALVARAMRPQPPLPVLGAVPAFHLVDQRGAPYGHGAMAGHVSVVDFVFTRCPSSCPRLTARMGELQARLKRDGSDARLVSFSVDPENDTPPVLAAYAAKAGADPARWTFVTGPVDDVSRAVVLGFKMSAAKVYSGANDYDVTHGDWFVLTDGAGGIRGYYPTDEQADFEKLVTDVERLEKEKR
jgi:protein SCO1/2